MLYFYCKNLFINISKLRIEEYTIRYKIITEIENLSKKYNFVLARNKEFIWRQQYVFTLFLFIFLLRFFWIYNVYDEQQVIIFTRKKKLFSPLLLLVSSVFCRQVECKVKSNGIQYKAKESKAEKKTNK